ncbi:MAG: S46 family peptidase, partial [Bacteroidetes bacterium]|nr:S46 family peptidase [Bacteroidota bacterium]
MKKIFISLFLCLVLTSAFAVEGMWIPTLLKKYNIEEMQKMGFKLSADDIYNVNHASMKDAVVLFGSGCTGELISGDGLLITNHHCGFGQIQKHSTLSHDYLTDGFWAKNRSEELVNPGLTVQFLVKMEEVTALVTKGVKADMPDDTIKKLIAT